MSSRQFNINSSKGSQNNQTLRKYRPLAPKLPYNQIINSNYPKQNTQILTKQNIPMIAMAPNIPMTAASNVSMMPMAPNVPITTTAPSTSMTTMAMAPNTLMTASPNILAARLGPQISADLTNDDVLSEDKDNFLPYDDVENQENILVSIKSNFYNLKCFRNFF